MSEVNDEDEEEARDFRDNCNVCGRPLFACEAPIGMCEACADEPMPEKRKE